MPKLTIFKHLTRDSPIWRVPLDQLTNSELEEFLTGIRELRLKGSQKYQEVVNRRAAARSSKLAERLSDQIRMFQKDITQMDKAFDRIDKRITTIIAVRLELEDIQPHEVMLWRQELALEKASEENSQQ